MIQSWTITPRLEELMSCPAVPCKCTCKCHLGPIRVLLWIVLTLKIPQTNAYSLQVGASLLVFSRNRLESFSSNMVAGHLLFWPRCRTTPAGVKFSLIKLTRDFCYSFSLDNELAIISCHTSTAKPGLQGFISTTSFQLISPAFIWLRGKTKTWKIRIANIG